MAVKLSRHTDWISLPLTCTLQKGISVKDGEKRYHIGTKKEGKTNSAGHWEGRDTLMMEENKGENVKTEKEDFIEFKRDAGKLSEKIKAYKKKVISENFTSGILKFL